MSSIGHNKPPLDPKETIIKNIERKKPILDRNPQFFNSVPLPSWIELSLIDNCNRSCSFCPKSDEKIAPNTHQIMDEVLINKLYEDLSKIKFNGAFCFCGYGEPLLHKKVLKYANILGQLGGVEIVTNGDTLNEKQLIEIYNSRVTRLLISLYDGEHQINKFKKMISSTGIPEDFVILRDRWYSDKLDFGVKLTNRVGTIETGKQDEIDLNRGCFYTSYQLLIDWNGDIFLCPQDWQRRVTMGNIMQRDFFDIWNGKILNKFRKIHQTNRKINPCSSCNANGDVYGLKHFEAWENFYKK